MYIVTVHMTGAWHRNKRPRVLSYFYNAGSSSGDLFGESSVRVATCESSGSSISPSISFVNKSQTATAEILLALQTVKHNYYPNLYDKVSEINKNMYAESAIA